MKARSNAFTLIELLIVVAIIGILAAIAVPNFLNAQIRAKVSRAYADLRTLSTALESYNVDNNAYPGGKFWDTPSWWAKHSYRFRPLTTPVAYLSTVPMDPFQGKLPANANPIWDGGYVYDDSSRPGNTMHIYGKNYKYTIRSWGPAQNWEDAHANFISFYHASNGLISRGLIAYLGPGGTIY